MAIILAPAPIRDLAVSKSGLLTPTWQRWFAFLAPAVTDPPGCWMTKASGNFTHNSSGNWLIYPADTAHEDNDGIADTANNALVIRTAGIYLVWFTVTLGAGASANLNTEVWKNGASLSPGLRMDFVGTYVGDGLSGCYRLVAGDSLTLHCYQNSGGDGTVYGALTSFGVQWVRR